MKKEKEDKIENSAMTLLKERAMVFSAFESGIFLLPSDGYSKESEQSEKSE